MQRFPTFLSLLLLLVFTGVGCAEQQGASESYADTMRRAHDGETPEATSAAQEPMTPVQGQMVQYGTVDGQALRGYLAHPENADSIAEARGLSSGEALPGLLVVHEWWGLNDNIKTMARRLAGEGYRALAVDLYGGDTAATPDQAKQLIQRAMEDEAKLMENMQAGYQYLDQEQNAPQIGVIGWCFGGGVTMQTALALPTELDAAVIYYGRPVMDRERLAELDMPILGLFGGADESIPSSRVDSFEQILNDLGKTASVHVYEGAGHAFANPSGQRYDPEAARDAWDKTTRFLQQHLYPQSAGMTGDS